MPATRDEVLPIRASSDVVQVRQLVRTRATELGFSLVAQTKIGTAASITKKVAVKSQWRFRTPPAMPISSRSGRST